MINLFPLPYWAPALQRVPNTFRLLNEAFTQGRRSFAKDADERPAFSPRKPRWTAEKIGPLAADPLAGSASRKGGEPQDVRFSARHAPHLGPHMDHPDDEEE